MEEIVKRITQILEEQQLSSSAFADTIGVQRSSISHVLSGRNKPSLEFILKTVRAFPPTLPIGCCLVNRLNPQRPTQNPLSRHHLQQIKILRLQTSPRERRVQQYPIQLPTHKLRSIRLFCCIKMGVLQSTSTKMINFEFKICYESVFPFCNHLDSLYFLLSD